ncbi:MAG: glycosyltransferase family 2 protein [Armatimonadetes bacterium]|nr:glycosyltransferase family 2 protein [Armatimonadota bacterium]
MKVAAVIPAFNEEHRIARVLHAVAQSKLIDDVIVVSDGSTDDTALVAGRLPGVTVLDLPANLGKGGAMCAGVEYSDADVIVFFDADLIGLRAKHVDSLVAPVLHGADMAIGIFRRGKFWSDAAQVISPYISGQRALRREIIEQIPWLAEVRMGVEVAINRMARRRHLKIKRVVLDGVTHTSKEQKFGLMKGTAQRAKMYAEIGRAMVRARKDR